MKNLYKIEDELYIVSSSEKIKENTQSFKQGLNGDWFYNTIYNFIARTGDITPYDFKVILTTNKLLIKDGVQAIDDEFLEWFCKNPSCEEVKVHWIIKAYSTNKEYKIIIPSEEPKQGTMSEVIKQTIDVQLKQETLEEAIERLYGAGYEALTKDQRMMRFCRLEGFMDGSDWQKERKRNIVITHIGSKETLEEAISKFFDNKKHPTSLEIAEFGAKWQSKRSQQIVPFDAYNIEVFAIKPDEQGKLFAYIGYNITNGNFHFNVVPFTEPKQEKEKYSEEDMDNYAEYCTTHVLTSQTGHPYLPVKEWFEKIKNK